MAARVKKIWRVTPIPEKCTGCMTCMAICSLSREGKVSPALARIHLHTTEEEWLKGSTNRVWTQQICLQCAGVAPCIAVCPVDALFRDEERGTVLINHGACINCGKCVKACPYGGIWTDEKTGKLVKCDTCDGKPQCVQWCRTEALVYEKVC